MIPTIKFRINIMNFWTTSAIFVNKNTLIIFYWKITWKMFTNSFAAICAYKIRFGFLLICNVRNYWIGYFALIYFISFFDFILCDIHTANTICRCQIFPWERKYYTKSLLKTHLDTGDKGDYSHRGHPKCRFCNVHYLDIDALARHVHRDHFQCHICENNGRSNEIFR